VVTEIAFEKVVKQQSHEMKEARWQKKQQQWKQKWENKTR